MAKKKCHMDMSARYLGVAEGHDFTRLFAQYSNIALKRFEWKNLPKGITSKEIEQGLYKHGQVFFTQDENFGLIALPCSTNGNYNVYGNPTQLLLTGFGYTKTFPIDAGVRILDNWMEYPLVRHVQHYVGKLEDLEYSIQRNIEQQNHPYIFSCTKNNEFTIKQVFNKIKNREEAIYVDKQFNDGDGIGLEATDISKPYTVDKYRAEYYELEKELLTLLGINCIYNKEGGMSTTELNANNMLIDMYLEDGLRNRQEAAKAINEKYGTNIEVVACAREIERLYVEEMAQNMMMEDKKPEKDGESADE